MNNKLDLSLENNQNNFDKDEIIEITKDHIEEEDYIIELTEDCFVKDKKIDIEQKFNYLNPFFFILASIIFLAFILQIKYWLFELWEKVDLNNFTYKYSNYKYWDINWIFTWIFLHWSIDHLIWNLLFFYIFSLIISRIYNLAESISLFLFLWIFSWLFSHFLNEVPSIWSSWAIFGLFWVSTVFYFFNRKKLENNSFDLIWTIPFFVLYNVFIGFINPIIDNNAHIFWYVWWIIIWYFTLKNKKIT